MYVDERWLVGYGRWLFTGLSDRESLRAHSSWFNLSLRNLPEILSLNFEDLVDLILLKQKSREGHSWDISARPESV